MRSFLIDVLPRGGKKPRGKRIKYFRNEAEVIIEVDSVGPEGASYAFGEYAEPRWHDGRGVRCGSRRKRKRNEQRGMAVKHRRESSVNRDYERKTKTRDVRGKGESVGWALYERGGMERHCGAVQRELKHRHGKSIKKREKKRSETKTEERVESRRVRRKEKRFSREP